MHYIAASAALDAYEAAQGFDIEHHAFLHGVGMCRTRNMEALNAARTRPA
jgi:hypothetical protein